MKGFLTIFAAVLIALSHQAYPRNDLADRSVFAHTKKAKKDDCQCIGHIANAMKEPRPTRMQYQHRQYFLVSSEPVSAANSVSVGSTIRIDKSLFNKSLKEQ